MFVVRPDNYECSAQNSILSSIDNLSLKEQTNRSKLSFKISKGITETDVVKAIMIIFGVYSGFSLIMIIITFTIYKYKNWNKTDNIDTSITIPTVDVKELLNFKEEDVKLVALDTLPNNDKKASNYCYHIANIGLFYGLPVIQLMVTYQRVNFVILIVMR